MKKQLLFVIKIAAAVVVFSSCTKTRKAELSEDMQESVFAISDFGMATENSNYLAKVTAAQAESNSLTPLAISSENRPQLHSHEVQVPERMKYMFEKMPILNMQSREFAITFSVDREYVTVYKIAKDLSKISAVEKLISVTAKELQLNSNMAKAAPGQAKSLSESRVAANAEKENIKMGKIKGSLLIPLFKYRVESYGTIARSKNELKEETSRLELKSSDWKDATHIKISTGTDARLMVGMGVGQNRQLKQIFAADRIDNMQTTAEEFEKTFSVGLRFMDPKAKVFTRLDYDVMHIYEITTKSALPENVKRLLANGAGNQSVLSCKDESVAKYISSTDPDCVILLTAELPISYTRPKLSEVDPSGISSERIEFEQVPRSQSGGLVEIKENSNVRQSYVSTILDPNSSLKLSDLEGEFYYRRTFEGASNMFLGRMGTSGDMAIVKFELKDDRIVVRNQKSLIEYTGQGAEDREELMSFPVKYFKLYTQTSEGSPVTLPRFEEVTRTKADYALIDWTRNTVPDAVSPLAFYSGGDCFMANSSLDVTDTDMRLATDGVLNYSLSGSYTMKPDDSCVAIKDTNSAYWKGFMQFNFNIKERISFMKHKDKSDDQQFSENISPMAQAAFNFGVFTLADLATESGTLSNRDGSEKYMPIIHDFRKGKVLTYHLGGINNPEITSAERREVLVSSAEQVVAEWNKTLKMAFRGTDLARNEDYIKLVIDSKETEGHLGDLDRNYIWFNELPAENGLLGVAQPAVNPRSGTVKSSNVIIYTGNTFEQAERLLLVNRMSREYEKTVEKIKEKAIAEAKLQKANKENILMSILQGLQMGPPAQPAGVNPEAAQRLKVQLGQTNAFLQETVQAFAADKEQLRNSLQDTISSAASSSRPKLSKDNLGKISKGREVKYDVNSETFLKKLTELAVNNKASDNPFAFELAVNEAFLKYGNLSQQAQLALQKRSAALATAVRFEESNKNRAGCYSFSRSDINDMANDLDPDPKKNLMLNFKQTVMSSLSHELGHAFGLLHNYKASTDKANYEFKDETGKAEDTKRNYSSIMDYIADIDMQYAGPGPYDVHAIRAAYTGMVELSDDAKQVDEIKLGLGANAEGLVKMQDVAAAVNSKYVDLTKDTLNKRGLTRYFEQCDDTELRNSALCKQFDVGGSASEIVENYIQDYNRGYFNSNYVYDKIIFDEPQKIKIRARNIALFQGIRAFLDEAVTTVFNSPGLPDSKVGVLIEDQLKAAKKGYVFFQEIIRTPSISGASIMRPVVPHDPSKTADSDENKAAEADKANDTNGDGLVANEERFMVYPYTYKNSKGEDIEDFKVIEARSLFDIQANAFGGNIEGGEASGDRNKIDTVGIQFDKAFAMMFLLQSTAAENKDDVQKSKISYVDFEQWFMGIEDPTQSPTMNTILDVLSKDLKYAFYSPSEEIDGVNLVTVDEIPVQVSRLLSEQTVVATIIGLEENKFQVFDAYAELFKVGRGSEASAPKDRLNVGKPGQVRGQADSKVYFPVQNAVGSKVLIEMAAINEFFTIHKEEMQKAMKDLYTADSIYRSAINKKKNDACMEDENSDKCKAAMAKPVADYIKEDPDMAKAKADADVLATAFLARLRELNKNEMILPHQLDVDGSGINLERQVGQLRLVLSQIDTIISVKDLFESAPAEEIPEVEKYVVTQLRNIKKKNQQLESFPLMLTAFNFVGQAAAKMEIKLANDGVIRGSTIAKLMMNSSKIEDNLTQQMDVIDKLAILSNAVDPDTVLQ